MLLLPTFALLLASLSFAVQIDLIRDEKFDDTSVEADMLYILDKYAAISSHYYNRTGEHLNVVKLDCVDRL